ncbi:hypothetical protein U9M48_000477, partial [Paspalum notatum var. saurae]
MQKEESNISKFNSEVQSSQ